MEFLECSQEMEIGLRIVVAQCYELLVTDFRLEKSVEDLFDLEFKKI